MPGTLLLDDWQNAVQDRLNEHIKNLQASTQSALEQVAQPVQQIQQALPQIDPSAIGARLNGLVESLTQQPAAQTFQPIGQNIQDQLGQTLAPVGEAKDAIAQRLQAHVDSLTAPQMPQVQSLGAPAAAGADVLGAPSADTLGAPLHEPSPPQQTPGTQVANTPDDSGRIFPLAGRPSNTPTATYHSQGGSDLMAPRGTPVLNMQNGRVDEVFTDNGSHTVGGNAVLVHGDDGLDYYYAHFDQPPSVKPGQRVSTGEQIGAVGNSGNAYKGGQGETHLHIGIGHGISNGVGSEGGLGQDFNAQKLLTDLESGIGQAATTARDVVQTAGAAVRDKVGQGQQDFVNSLQPLAQEVASRTGIDPNAMLAIAANETGWGRSQTAQQQNNLFSIQGDGSNGSRWATYSSPTQAFDAFVNLIKSAPRYAQAWADRADPGKFVDDLRHAGYVVDEPGFPAQGWVDQVKSIYGRLPPSSDQSGPSPQRAAAAGPVALGEAPSAQPVLYATTKQPATALGDAGQRPANEVLPQAVQAIGEGVGQAASNLGSAAQSALGAISEANRVQPGTAALQAAQQVTAPGGPVGQVASDLGTAVSSAYGLNRSLEDQQARNDQYQRDVQAAAEAMNRRSQEPQTLGGVASGVWGLITGANPPMGISLQQYQDQQQVKNQWIEQNNPAKDVPIIGGVTSGLAQQLTDPLMLATFGPSVGAGRAIGAGAARGVEAGLAERLSPQAVQFAATVADKLTSGAFIGGVQNALMAAEKPDATPESVFEALWQGAVFGGAVDVGAAAVTPIARRIGQQLIDQAPELRAALRSRQPAQAEINAALGGAPEAVARVGERLQGAEPEIRSAEPVSGERTRGEVAQPLTAETTPVERYHYTPNGDFTEFKTGDRGVVYLAESPMQALAGAQAGYRENVRRSAGIPTAVREESGRLLRVNAADDMRVFQDDWPSQMSAGEHDAALERFDTAKQGQPPEVQQALDRLRSLSTGRPGQIEGDTIRYNASPAVLSHVEAERPAMQQALRVLGYDAAKVGDEAGTSLAVLEPSKLNITGRAPAQASIPFATNLAGAAVGGYAGNAATPEDAPLDVRLRNIGLGASAGLLGTHALTRGGGRFAEAVAARVEGRGVESRGFTAPERPTLEDQLLQARTRAPGGEPPPVRPPRNLNEVASNPHLLREAAPGETPMTTDERLAHQDTLSERYQANADRLNAIDEQLRNPGKGPERPPWAGGFSNDQVAEMAAKVGRSPYEPLWWEKAGLETGSGEVRALINESGIQRGMGQRDPTPAELRREAAQLTQDQRHLEAAGEQLATAPDDARLVRPPERTPVGELPFSEGGARDEGAQLAQEVVTKKGGIASDQNQVVAVDTATGIGGRGIVNPAEVVTEAPSKETAARMPNLNAIGKDMPETIAQIQKSAEDNPELWDHYQQGRISFDSLKNDLAARVGMSKEDWLKTKVGQALNPQEMVALQAAMVEEQARQTDLARTILAKGGVDKLTPEELAYSITQLTQAQALSAVAKGAGSTVARSLNARKISFTRQLASDITSANERKAAQRVKAQAARVATRAGDLLEKAAATDKEKVAAVARARTEGAPKNIVDQIAAAYDELDRYNAMSLHEKAAVFDKLKADRDAAAAARKAAVRGAPEELLSALKQELKAEQDNFAKRKSTWETMALQDEKAFGNMMDKRTAFRGGLYIETQRKSAQLALQNADKEMNRAFDAEMQRRGKQSDKAQKLLESMGGVQVTKDLLNNYIAALNDPDSRVAAKFLQSTASMSNWAKATTLRLAGLLSSPITQMVNIGGNVSGAIVEVPTRALVVGIDALRAAATGGERQAYAGELIPMLKAYGPGMLGALPEAVRTLKTGITAEQLADPTRIRGRFSPSEKVNVAVEAPLRALQAEDVIFRQAAFSAHGMRVASRQAIREGFKGKMVEERAATILKNLEDYPELAKEAQDAAARQVYQERRAVPGLGQVGEQADAVRFATSQVVPFVRTPMNITAQGAGMSPLGAMGVLQAAGKARNMPVGTAAERAARGREVLLAEERGARAVIGSALLGGGLALGGAGMLTAAYPADPTEASTLPQGWRPWSLRMTSPVDNNTYYIPLQNMGPIGMPLAMASILTDPKHRDAEGSILDPQEQQRAVMGLGRYVIDNTFLQGISDMVDALHDPKTGASKFLEPWAASYGPYSSLARESQRMMGVASRNPHDGLMGLVEAFEANYPGLSGNVPEALTPLGEPRTQGATGLARTVPFRYDIERDNATLQVLRDNKVGIPLEPKQMNIGRGQSLDLTEDEQAQVKRERGAAIKQAVDEVQKTRAWQSSDLSARNALLKQAVNYATQNANIRFYQSLTPAEVQSRAKDRAVPEPYYLGAAPA